VRDQHLRQLQKAYFFLAAAFFFVAFFLAAFFLVAIVVLQSELVRGWSIYTKSQITSNRLVVVLGILTADSMSDGLDGFPLLRCDRRY
jgi:hypothetical protein